MDITFDGIIFVLMIGAQFLGVIAVYNARLSNESRRAPHEVRGLR